jgi:probable HAF family extracellular repeat protein
MRCGALGWGVRWGIGFGLPWMLSAAVSGQCHYTYVEVENPPGWTCVGQAINSLGHVAGFTNNLGDTNRAFVWSPESGTTLLPLLPGVDDMEAFALNDLGHVTGRVQAGPTQLAFFWNGQDYTIILPPAWASETEGFGINNLDQVVGLARAAGGPTRAFVWQNGLTTDIGSTLGYSFSSAQGVNQLGQIAGYAADNLWLDARGFIQDGTETHWLAQPSELTTGRPNALSNNGVLVGEGTTTPLGEPGFGFVGIIWTPTDVHIVRAPPGTRDARLLGINDAGRAVGYISRGLYRPIAWQNGQVVDLSELVSPAAPDGLRVASAINNVGQIVAQIAHGTAVLNPVWLTGDVTGDCDVRIEDLLIVLSDFGSGQGTFPRGDVDIDGDVDIHDLTVLLANWGD